MHVTDLAMNKALGMELAPAGSGHLIEMAEAPLLLNHLGSIHASAQFALAEACSAEFLINQLGEAGSRTMAVLRTSDVKYRKPANGALRAAARFSDSAEPGLLNELTSRGRALASIAVEVSDVHGVVTMTGTYSWFLQKAE